MTVENDEMGDHPDDYSDDYSDDDSYAADQLQDQEYEDEYEEGEYEDEGEYEEEEFEEERQSSRGSSSRSKKKKRRMFCGGCNRIENHRRAARSSWINSYVTGLCFGLNHLVGPFKCTCCGSNRWIIRLKKSNAVIVKSKSKSRR